MSKLNKKTLLILAFLISILVIALFIFAPKDNKKDLPKILSNLSTIEYSVSNIKESDDKITANFKFKESIQESHIVDLTKKLADASSTTLDKPININLLLSDSVDTSKFYDNQIGSIDINSTNSYTYYSEFKNETIAETLSKYKYETVEFNNNIANIILTLDSSLSAKEFYKESLLYLDVLKNANKEEVKELNLSLKSEDIELSFNSKFPVIKTTTNLK